jgi:hypothetical protein
MAKLLSPLPLRACPELVEGERVRVRVMTYLIEYL